MSYGQKNATLMHNISLGSTPDKQLCSGQMCMSIPANSLHIEFTYDEEDNPDEIWKDEIMYNVGKTLNLSNTPIVPLTENSNWGSVQLLTPFSLNGNAYNTLTTLDDSKWLFIVKLFALNFGFSPNRIINVSMDPIFSNSKVTSINVSFYIANFIENPNRKSNIPEPDGALPNDSNSAICLGLWIKDVLDSKTDMEYLSNTIMPDKYKNNNICLKNPGVNPDVLRRSIRNVAPSSTDIRLSKERFKNTQENKIDNNVFEHLTVKQVKPVDVAPRTITDYIFMFSYLISFLGAIFFSMASLIQIDPSTLIANKNISFVLNLFIGVCGIVSMIIWVNYDINFDALYLFGLNHAVVKQTI